MTGSGPADGGRAKSNRQLKKPRQTEVRATRESRWSFRDRRVGLPTPIAVIVADCLRVAQKLQSPSYGPAVALSASKWRWQLSFTRESPCLPATSGGNQGSTKQIRLVKSPMLPAQPVVRSFAPAIPSPLPRAARSRCEAELCELCPGVQAVAKTLEALNPRLQSLS
jgi:hypothetical protein